MERPLRPSSLAHHSLALQPSGYQIPADFGSWVARDQFVEYLGQYAAHHHLEPQFGVEVTRIDRDDGRWLVRTTTGTIPAGVVVVASGHTRVPYLPHWPGAFDGPVVHSVEYRNSQPYRGKDVLVVGAGNSGTDIAIDLAEGGAGRVRIAVRTPPNILRRDIKGFPIQLIGIAVHRVPPRLLDPLFGALRRATIPDLSAKGLPSPSAPFSQFRSTATVPILDVGFVDAVRNGSIEVVPGSRRSTDGPSSWLMGHGCFRTSSSQRPATNPGSSRSSATSQPSDRMASQARSQAFTSSGWTYRSLASCTK